MVVVVGGEVPAGLFPLPTRKVRAANMILGGSFHYSNRQNWLLWAQTGGSLLNCEKDHSRRYLSKFDLT